MYLLYQELPGMSNPQCYSRSGIQKHWHINPLRESCTPMKIFQNWHCLKFLQAVRLSLGVLGQSMASQISCISESIQERVALQLSICIWQDTLRGRRSGREKYQQYCQRRLQSWRKWQLGKVVSNNLQHGRHVLNLQLTGLRDRILDTWTGRCPGSLSAIYCPTYSRLVERLRFPLQESSTLKALWDLHLSRYIGSTLSLSKRPSLACNVQRSNSMIRDVCRRGCILRWIHIILQSLQVIRTIESAACLEFLSDIHVCNKFF